MNIIIYEDNNTDNLKPFSINHASFEMQCGIMTNLERIIHHYSNYEGYNEIRFILLVRPEIEDMIRLKYPDLIVNPENIPKGKYMNGSFLHAGQLNLDDFPDMKTDNDLVHDFLFQFKNIWDPVFMFKEIFKIDFNSYGEYFPENIITDFNSPNNPNYNKDNNIMISETANIKEGVILDTSNGPIIINKGVNVNVGSLLQGPLFIDKNSYIALGAKIRPGTMIGQNCKVGGEVSNSIFYQNSNKVHDGFIGDSFIGEWVNIGAGTNNSNLKNNYSNIKFSFNGKDSIDTGCQFLGAMIGDYTRIGISSMLTAGSYIGLGSNIFGSGFQDKYIPSFTWGQDGMKTDFDKFVNTCKKMYFRRDEELSEIEIEFLRLLYNKG